MIFAPFVNHLKSVAQQIVKVLSERLGRLTEPARDSFVGGVVSDVVKSKEDLLAENTLLRQQVIVLQRQIKRPRLNGQERRLLVLLAS